MVRLVYLDDKAEAVQASLSRDEPSFSMALYPKAITSYKHRGGRSGVQGHSDSPAMMPVTYAETHTIRGCGTCEKPLYAGGGD